jgi:hypothetical protein
VSPRLSSSDTSRGRISKEDEGAIIMDGEENANAASV